MPDPHACHLAQINVARMLHPLGDPRMASFVARLDRVNALADTAQGFVGGSRTRAATRPACTPSRTLVLVNLSVWRSVEALFEFVYRSLHTEPLRLRKDWFEKPALAHKALWWLPAGTLPTPAEGRARLEHLRRHGPNALAFTFKERFPPPQSEAA